MQAKFRWFDVFAGKEIFDFWRKIPDFADSEISVALQRGGVYIDTPVSPGEIDDLKYLIAAR